MTSLLSAFGEAFTAGPSMALAAAFAWGVLSVVLSPCHLTSIPLVVAYVNGGSTAPPLRRAVGLSAAFALGTLISTAAIGAVTVLLGRVAGDVGAWGNYAVAALFVLMGLQLLDVVQLPLGFSGPKAGPRHGAWSALLLGLLFGVALGPCAFAFMGPLLGLAFRAGGTATGLGVGLIALYGLGHASVLAAAGASSRLVERLLSWNSREQGARWLKRSAGVAVVLGGLYFLWTAR